MKKMPKKDAYDKLLQLYKENCHLPWDSWLLPDVIFPEQGKQGCVGTMKVKSNPEFKMVFKISRGINHLVEHELFVMEQLNNLSKFCPHYCRSIGPILANVNGNKNINPFEISQGSKLIEKEVLLTEMIDKSEKFSEYIYSEKNTENNIYSIIKQTLLAFSIAYRNCKFSHYDAHSDNVLIKKCDKNIVHLYIIDESNQFAVPTYGKIPVVIDYGFSYVEQMKGEPLWQDLNHTDYGFLSYTDDPIVDPRIFLSTSITEIRDVYKNKKSKLLKNIIRNLYCPLNIDPESGWYHAGIAAIDAVVDKIRKINDLSPLFKEYSHYTMNIIQTLIILPIEQQNYTDLKLSYLGFISEFVKIEKEISSPFYCLYILKRFVDVARTVRAEYTNPQKREETVLYVKRVLNQIIDSVVKFCIPKNLNVEKMLCSLYCSTRCMEGVLYKQLSKIERKKNKMYSRLKVSSSEEIAAIIDINIPDDYIYNSNTVILVIDSDNKKTDQFELSTEQCKLVNSTVSISRGYELFQIYRNKLMGVKN